jgi:small-conductance mechanosensitive channel
MPTSPQLHALLSDFWSDLHSVKALWQIAVIALSFLLAAIPARLLARRAKPSTAPRPLGREALHQLLFPALALLLILFARGLLQPVQSVALLNIMVPLLTSLAIARFAVLMLRQVFAPSVWLDALSRIIMWAIWVGFALYISGLAPTLLESLDQLGFTVGKQRISLLLVLQGTLSLISAILIALWLGRFVEARLMAAESVQMSLRVMLSKLAQALFVLLAVLIALPAVGIDLTVLSVFGGMLGVGIGFGLQKIASNYVSGFIILMDRSVSIGDVISVDQHSGRVTKMTARYVVLRNPAGTEALIPNETLIGSPVINHTYTDRRVHVPIAVQVSYDCDLDKAVQVLEQIATRHRRSLAEPAPRVSIKEFADSGINLELGVWIEDPEEGTGNIRSDLYFDIWREFRQAGIEIPYPQREVRLHAPLPVATG